VGEGEGVGVGVGSGVGVGDGLAVRASVGVGSSGGAISSDEAVISSAVAESVIVAVEASVDEGIQLGSSRHPANIKDSIIANEITIINLRLNRCIIIPPLFL
jgi:hypothetical protein